LRTESSTVYS